MSVSVQRVRPCMWAPNMCPGLSPSQVRAQSCCWMSWMTYLWFSSVLPGETGIVPPNQATSSTFQILYLLWTWDFHGDDSSRGIRFVTPGGFVVGYQCFRGTLHPTSSPFALQMATETLPEITGQKTSSWIILRYMKLISKARLCDPC